MKWKFKIPRFSKRTGRKLARVGGVVVTVAQVALKELERTTRKIK
jgi:hypothetical protein